jgi:hypothetical protein
MIKCGNYPDEQGTIATYYRARGFALRDSVKNQPAIAIRTAQYADGTREATANVFRPNCGGIGRRYHTTRRSLRPAWQHEATCLRTVMAALRKEGYVGVRVYHEA